MKIEALETRNDDFVEKSSENVSVYRYARIINSEVNRSIIGDYAYVKDSSLGNNVLINRNAFILNSKIGDKSQIGFNTKVMYAEIGKFCSISWDCSIGGPNHNMKACTTYNLTGDRSHYIETECVIKDDVWIGSGVTVMRGLSIGCGSVIGSGSVVTHDVFDYEIVAGVPARHLGWRFDEGVRKRLKESRWWELPLDVIKDNHELFSKDINEKVLEQILILTSNNS